MLYSVVVVEDEPLVLKEIVETTPWEELGLKVVGQAKDGNEGEKIINALNPDLVITDIRLPGIDGFEMLENTSSEHSIILSGYSDFPYARKAIQLGVFDYLLKPYEDEDLYKTLKKVVKLLEEEEKDYDKLKYNIEVCENFHIKKAIDYIKANYFKAISLTDVSDNLKVTDSYLSRLFKEEMEVNFLQYLNAYRIKKSLELMNNPEMNINQIATACGFANSGYYSKIFKKLKGVTPTLFRDKSS